MKKEKYLFGDIVVIEEDQIGVIVKVWERLNGSEAGVYWYEVYIRNERAIREFEENNVERYRIRHKELNEEELEWQNN